MSGWRELVRVRVRKGMKIAVGVEVTGDIRKINA